jgi:hypothetical protein
MAQAALTKEMQKKKTAYMTHASLTRFLCIKKGWLNDGIDQV